MEGGGGRRSQCHSTGGCDFSEPDSSLLSPVLSTSHYTEQRSHSPEYWQTLPLLSTVAPRVIDEKLDFKHPLETIEMSP